MITKERLEELIEKGKPIYSTDTKFYGCVRMLELENQPEKLQYDKNGEVKLFITDNGWWHWFSLKDLYESKEDVEEILEFGNITRTERLEMPSWEQVQEGFYYNGSVPIYEDDRNLCFISTSKDIVLKNYASLKNQTKFKKPLTRENYNEVRRLCVKLFKGETDVI